MLKNITSIVFDYYYNLKHYNKYINAIQAYNENYKYDDILNYCYIGTKYDHFMFNYRKFYERVYNIHSIHAFNLYYCNVNLTKFKSYK